MTRSLALMRSSALTLLLFGSACSGGGDDGDDDTVAMTAPVITDFSVDRDFVQANDTVVVSWNVQRANSVTITQNDGRGLAPETFNTIMGSKPYDIVRDTEFVLEAKNELGETAMATITVAVDGIKIDSFTASATAVNRRDPVDLAWMISGEAPMSVTIEDGDGNEFYSGTNAAGSVTVRPEADVTYTLTAEGSTGTKTESVSITVQSSRPTITRFAVEPDNVVQINVEEANLVWTTTADEVQVLQDGVAVRPWNAFGATAGNLQRPVTTAMTVFTLQARNTADPNDVVEESVTVTGLETPTIVTFEVSPLEYTQGSTMATVTWEVTTTDSVELRLNNTRVTGFPTTDATGSVTIPVTGQPRVRLLATNAVTTVEQSVQITFGFDEAEPNDSALDAIPIPGDGVGVRGTISDAADVDWYVVQVPQDALMFARAGFVETMGVEVCSFDTFIRVYTSTLAEIGSNDNGPGAIAPCSLISALTHPFAEQMDAGTYYISVTGTGTMPQGAYSLEVSFGAAPTGLPLTATPVGAPVWSIGGLQMWQGPLGMTGEAVPPEIDFIYQGFHQFAAFGLISVITEPLLPMPRDDYSNLLPLFLQTSNTSITTTFPSTALVNGNAIYLGYTVYPNANAPTGASFDSASGPIIPNGVFPITMNMTIQNGGVDYVVPDAFDMPSYAGFATSAAPPLPAVPNAGDGDSHRHFITLIADLVAVTPGGALAGNYTWSYQLRDATGAGYDFTVPFTVQ